jgi:hypothetical protein
VSLEQLRSVLAASFGVQRVSDLPKARHKEAILALVSYLENPR